MPQVTVSATARTAVGKGANRRLRASGQIPAVVYGGEAGSRSLSLSPRTITEILRSPRGENTIFSLEIAGETTAEQVMIHDYQLHPLDHSVLHADLMRVDPEKESHWHVPVHLTGDSVGVKRGGRLDFVTRTLTVICKPLDIPEHLSVDISALDYGDTVRASAIELPDDLELHTESEVVVVHVSPPKRTEEETTEEGAEETDEEPEEQTE